MSCRKNFVGTRKRVRISHGKRVIGVRVIESLPLRKQAYSNLLIILPPKSENFQIKNSDIFHITAQT